MNPIDRLRSADPARGLGAQPDGRGEADLRVLLAEPRPEREPMARPGRRRIAPVLVTAFVALAVVALTAAVLGVVHPRTDVGGSTAPTTGMIAPPYVLDDCSPEKVLPFLCGTYRSNYGAPSVTGDTGGPATDPLSISFSTTRGGVLVLTAVSRSCFAATLPVRYDGTRLVRAGELLVGESSVCSGAGTDDSKHWADAFLRGPLLTDAGSGTLVFNIRTAMVTFEYQGAAGIGERQLPRNETTCVESHVEPFTCSKYRSTTGTGALSFLASDRYSLQFLHINGQLTAGLGGGCNGLNVTLEPENGPAGLVVAIPGGVTSMLCPGAPAAHDAAVSAFFRGELTYRVTPDTIVFTKGTTSATFAKASSR